MAEQGEFSLIDVREHGIHSEGHPFFATPVPLSSLELRIERLVPNKSTLLIVLDQGPDIPLATRAAKVLDGLGYSNIKIIEGGVEAWRDCGFELFSGVNVPSKAFGEFVEETYETPHVSATELSEKIAGGSKVVILDSRPFPEFHRMSIPGGVDMPGAELVHRVFETVTDNETEIVVNCAGRTRSIIGAQSLINAGIPNSVSALKDGTMGWYLADLELAHREDSVAPPPNEAAQEKSQNAVQDVIKRFGVEFVEIDDVKAWQQDSDRNLFLLDVRSEEEFLSGHYPGSYHAPGGQLVQATDEYIGVRNSRIVLIDDNGTRAAMTASWLIQMNWQEVFVLKDGLQGQLEIGAAKVPEIKQHQMISAQELDAVIASREAVAVVDLGTSLEYRAGHVPGAYWAIRSRLATDHIYIPPSGLIILTSGDGQIAHLAAAEFAELRPEAIIRVLEGGTSAWTEASLLLESGETHLLSKTDDVWYKPYDKGDDAEIRQRMEDYLTWEVGLLQQIQRDGLVQFKRF
jgi:rhodanese-related sulfurtransferase